MGDALVARVDERLRTLAGRDVAADDLDRGLGLQATDHLEMRHTGRAGQAVEQGARITGQSGIRAMVHPV